MALGTIFKISTSGSFATLQTSVGPETVRSQRFECFGETDGNFYGVTFAGGAVDAGTVFRMDINGNITVLHSFTRLDGAFPASALIGGKDGSFYGATFNGGHDNGGLVYRFTVPGVSAIMQ